MIVGYSKLSNCFFSMIHVLLKTVITVLTDTNGSVLVNEGEVIKQCVNIASGIVNLPPNGFLELSISISDGTTSGNNCVIQNVLSTQYWFNLVY